MYICITMFEGRLMSLAAFLRTLKSVQKGPPIPLPPRSGPASKIGSSNLHF